MAASTKNVVAHFGFSRLVATSRWFDGGWHAAWFYLATGNV